MFKSIAEFFHKFRKGEKEESKSTAKERLHLVLAQDRANISADFLEMMKQEILEVIKKYIDIDEKAIDVRLTNKEGEDGKLGSPALYANIPIITIKNESRKLEGTINKENKEIIIEEENEEDKSKESNDEKQETENKDVEKDEEKTKSKEIEKNKDINEQVEDIDTSSKEEIKEEQEDNYKNLEEVDDEKKNS